MGDPERQRVGRLSAASLIKRLDEDAPQDAIRAMIRESDPADLRRVIGRIPDAQVQRVIDAVEPEDVARVAQGLAGRIDRVRLPDDVVIPKELLRTGWGFPFDRLPENRDEGLAIVRPSDLAVLRIGFRGMTRTEGTEPALRPSGDGPHLLIVTLPPQHLLEESFVLSSEGKLPADILLGVGQLRKLTGEVEPEPEPDPERVSALRFSAIDVAVAREHIRKLVVQPELVVAERLTEEGRRLRLEAGQEPPPPPVRAQLAGTSRLVFKVPSDAEPIPLTVEGILEAMANGRFELRLPDAVERAKEPKLLSLAEVATQAGLVLRALEPRTAPSAATLVMSTRRIATARSGMLSRSLLLDLDAVPILDVARPPQPAQPADDETAIELPHRLIIAPDKGAGLVHSTTPAEVDGRVELWTSWLDSTRRQTFRAVWSRDKEFMGDAAEADPFLSSLTSADRKQIVDLTSNAALSEGKYLPKPVDARALGLSALGAWLDAEGRWQEEDLPNGYDLLMWRHRAAMGRDTEVRVVYAGYLLPFGHKAALIKVTERRFHPHLEGNPAYLRTQWFVAVREPERQLGGLGLEYDGSDDARKGERFDLQCPLTRVRISTKMTPALDDPEDLSGTTAGPKEKLLFWPHIGGEPFRFAMEAIDHEGREVQFRMPLLLVRRGWLTSEGATEDDKVETPPGKHEAARRAAEVYDGTAATDKPTNGGAPAEWRTLNAAGNLIAFADPNEPDDTAFAAQTVEWGVGAPLTETTFDRVGEPYFAPVALNAEVEVPALKQFVPHASRMRVGYHGAFLKGGFNPAGSGAGEVFLRALEEVDLSFDSAGQNSGGFLTPNFPIAGLSRRLGPVGGDLADFHSDKLGPDQFKKIFESLGAKLFGAINLWDILGEIGIDDAVPKFAGQAMDAAQSFITALEQLKQDAEAAAADLGELRTKADEAIAAVEKILRGETVDLVALLTDLGGRVGALAERELAAQDAAVRRLARRADLIRRQLEDVAAFAQKLEGLAQGLEMATTASAKLEWRPKLVPFPAGSPVFQPNEERGLTLRVEAGPDPAAGGVPAASVSCTLVNFDLDLGPIRINFDKLELGMEPGQKPDVDVVLGEIRFEDELEFVQTLTEILPLDGFSDPPDLTVTEEGITASFGTSIPSISVGVLGIQDMSLSANCIVPFVGHTPLSFRFDFCEVKRPAVLTVGMFGGGAYFGVEVSPLGEHKLVALRAAFEFGAGVAIDFGVASGSILVRAGIYFEVRGDGGITLTGYFRMRGEVDVLGLISASIELRLELTYQNGKLRGRASLEIEVEIAFFSASVTIECERAFAGGNADPTFYEVMHPELEFKPWPEYCGAFA